jgi:hypothetical protein
VVWRAGIEVAAAAGHRLLHSEPSASETDLSFVGLSDLLADMLSEVAAQIPGPQREALEIALLLRPAGDEPPTAHAVGLAVLAALRGCLSEGPVLVAIETGDRLPAARPLIGAAAVESLPPGRRGQLYQRLADASSYPERYAHFAALAVGTRPDPAVADALDAAAAPAHARAGNATAAQFATRSVLWGTGGCSRRSSGRCRGWRRSGPAPR